MGKFLGKENHCLWSDLYSIFETIKFGSISKSIILLNHCMQENSTSIKKSVKFVFSQSQSYLCSKVCKGRFQKINKKMVGLIHLGWLGPKSNQKKIVLKKKYKDDQNGLIHPEN